MFAGMAYAGSAAYCLQPNACKVRSNPLSGCSAFVREPGADDESGPPSSDSLRVISVR